MSVPGERGAMFSRATFKNQEHARALEGDGVYGSGWNVVV
jgi:hypothetical protein